MQPLRRGDTGPAVAEIRRMLSQFGLLSDANDGSADHFDPVVEHAVRAFQQQRGLITDGIVGQMLTFFGEIGCQFPQFPFIAHSRGWSAEDMERNQQVVRESKSLHDGAAALARRSVEMARVMIASSLGAEALVRSGRKAQGEV